MTPEQQKAVNDSILATARSQLEQNRRLFDMIEQQMIQLDKIQLILADPYLDTSKLVDRITKVLYP